MMAEQNSDVVPVSGDVVRSAMTMLVRQVLIWASGIFFAKGEMDDNMLNAAASAVVFVLVTGFGQIKNWVEQHNAIALADNADIGVVVKHTGWLGHWARGLVGRGRPTPDASQ